MTYTRSNRDNLGIISSYCSMKTYIVICDDSLEPSHETVLMRDHNVCSLEK